MFGGKEKLDAILNGQSIIQEKPSATGAVAGAAAINDDNDVTLKVSSKPTPASTTASDEYRLKIVYFMRDFTQVTPDSRVFVKSFEKQFLYCAPCVAFIFKRKWRH